MSEEMETSEAMQNKLIELGRKLERKRIYDLEQIAPDNSNKLLYDAKYTNPMEAGEFAVLLVSDKAHKSKNKK